MTTRQSLSKSKDVTESSTDSSSASNSKLEKTVIPREMGTQGKAQNANVGSGTEKLAASLPSSKRSSIDDHVASSVSVASGGSVAESASLSHHIASSTIVSQPSVHEKSVTILTPESEEKLLNQSRVVDQPSASNTEFTPPANDIDQPFAGESIQAPAGNDRVETPPDSARYELPSPKPVLYR